MAAAKAGTPPLPDELATVAAEWAEQAAATATVLAGAIKTGARAELLKAARENIRATLGLAETMEKVIDAL